MARWSSLAPVLILLSSVGCMEGITQVAGVGAMYTTRCSADMEVKGVEYTARCEPAECSDGFASAAVSDVVVALDPGRKVVGYRERVCIQDLSDATSLFLPVYGEPTVVPPEGLAPEPSPEGEASM